MCVKTACGNSQPMRRLLAFILVALTLAVSSGPALAMPAADCPMAGSSSSPMTHDEMDCCKPACAPNCATLCPGAVMPAIGGSAAPVEPAATGLIALSPAPLRSTDLSGADPPPRTTFS